MSDDNRGGAEWPIDRRRDRIETSTAPDREPPHESVRDEPPMVRRKGDVNPIFIALGLVALLLLAWLLFGRGNSDQDKLSGAASENSAAAADPEKLCSSKSTYDLMKRELFRRAAQVRGSDQAVFDRLSAYAAIRMQNPVMESQDEGSGRVNCSGSLSLDLPPGVAVAGGRQSLSSDVDYSIQPAADGSGNVLTLRNADGIITPLATLTRTVQPAQPPTAPETTAPASEEDTAEAPAVAASPSPAPVNPPAPVQSNNARPSFNCAYARTRGERAVCGDAGLASLDRQMAAQFGRAVGAADAGQRALLEQTGRRFLSYRDRCGSDACIEDAYRGRMREIRDIMNGDWNPR